MKYEPKPTPHVSFTLSVTADMSGITVSTIKFDLDLNPNSIIPEEDEPVFGQGELKSIFAFIQSEIDAIVKHSITPVNKENVLTAGGNPVNLDVGRIGRIVYGHSSPGRGVVSFLSATNGDVKPPVR